MVPGLTYNVPSPLHLRLSIPVTRIVLPDSRSRIMILAGDVSPIDVITHIPVLCEENDIPYVYVPSKEVGPFAYDASLQH